MATLKISDLSVGDRVHHDFYEADMRVVLIYGDNKRVMAESSSGHGVTCHLDHFTPISITAEILERNGFVKSDDFLHKIDLPDNILLGVRRQTDGYIFELKREKRRIGELLVIIRGIRYIHQLQHALRLAGVDKEVNL